VKVSLLKQYYKAAAWPPFYVIAIPTLIIIIGRYLYNPGSFSVSDFYKDLVIVSFYSGMIAISCAGLFLCAVKKIACNLFYSLLSWFLLPSSVIAYIFFFQIDVSAVERENDPEMIRVGIMAAVVMFHVIGLIISFNAFRATIILAMREERNPVLKMTQMTELHNMDETLS
jgi:hypothetical protein